MIFTARKAPMTLRASHTSPYARGQWAGATCGREWWAGSMREFVKRVELLNR